MAKTRHPYVVRTTVRELTHVNVTSPPDHDPPTPDSSWEPISAWHDGMHGRRWLFVAWRRRQTPKKKPLPDGSRFTEPTHCFDSGKLR